MFQLENEKSERLPGSTATLDPPVMPEHEPSHVKKPVWTAIGSPILVVGVIMPSILFGVVAVNSLRTATEMVLRHPVETLLQYALVLCIPVGNYIVWNRVCHGNFANVARVGLLNGLAIGSSLLVTVACLAGYILKYPAIEEVTRISHESDFAICGMVAACAFLVSVYLMRKLRSAWETEGAKSSQLVYSLAGILLSIVAVGTTEARQVVIRANERAAVTEDTTQRATALSALRMPILDSARELKMDIADPKSGGLSGLFLGIDPSARRQLYFGMTAKPYESITELATDDSTGGTIASSSYDRFLASHVVGDLIPGFSLMRSQISGAVNSKTLTSNLDWTFVLKNKNYYEQEARAEIALPPGAVVSNMTLWMNGKPKDATISATEQAEGAYKWVVVSKRDPALIRYLGKGRVFIQCFPVPANKEIKLSLSITAPLKLDSGTQASLSLPRLVASNFSPATTHDVRLRSAGNLQLSAAGLHSVSSGFDDQLFVGKVKDQDAKNSALSVVASRPMTVGAFASKDYAYGGYSVESVKEVQNNAPKNLVVVVDGSQSVKEYKDDIVKMLEKVSSLMPTSVVIANTDTAEANEPVSVKEAVKQISDLNFDGGHDNLPAVIKAADTAGEREKSAVLWIHGPQPAFNEEMYITSQAASKPDFYELALDDGWTNTSEFFKNHQDIGPMTPVMRNGKLSDDLNRFLAQWQPGGHHYSVQLLHMNQKPNCPILAGKDAFDLSILGAAHTCKLLIAEQKRDVAARIASACHIVTPVTAGVVLEKSTDYERFNMNEANTQSALKQRTTPVATSQLANNDSLSGFGNQQGTHAADETHTATGIATFDGVGGAPGLQGATNGTIGPQGEDATYVTGLNTSGTVRVNNLANLEAILNLLANGLEILGIVVGVTLAIKSFIDSFKPRMFIFALSMITAGLAIPGMINWLVASARDSNLFN